VAANVFADADRLAANVEEAGRMQAAGALERRLGEPVGQIGEQRATDLRPRAESRRMDRDLLERALAADAARGGRVEAPAGGIAQQRPRDLDRVGGEIGRRAHLPRAGLDQPLAEEEPERKLLIASRGSHRHRDRLAVDADLERLLDRDPVQLAIALDAGEHPRGPVRRPAIGHRGRS
jgi:hypothetical protein